jgi:hypothetical protein
MGFWITVVGCAASALVTLPVPANAAQPVTVQPSKDGTLADGGIYGAFDGVADNVDWTFNQSSYEGAITLSAPATGPRFEYRVVWEYSLSTVSLTPPVSATLTVFLRGAPIYPRPDAEVQVFSYPADLAETTADFSSGPAQLQGILVVHPFQPATQYTVNVSNAVNAALTSGAKKVAFRFQIKPDAQQSANQAFIDASDSDPTSKPYLTIGAPVAPVLGDLDNNRLVDDDDLAIFEACATGPAMAYSAGNLGAGCPLIADDQGFIAADFDKDRDVDQADFAVLERCLSIPGVEVNPNCRL